MFNRLFGKNVVNTSRFNYTNPNALIYQGSQTFKYSNAAIIAAGATAWVALENEFPASRLYLPLDSFEIINNSAQVIQVFINSQAESYDVPSYMIKPVARRPVRQFGIKNGGLANIAIGEVIIHFRRLPPDITPVANVG